MAGGAEVEAGRVAEVIVALGEDRGRRGSGYLIATGTVLTAAHVVDDAVTVAVRFDADRPAERTFQASVAWRHDGIHVAVLTLAGAGPEEVSATPLGRVGEHDAEVRCSAAGFPLHKLRDGDLRDGDARYRDLAHVFATCPAFSNRREGTLELKVDVPPASVGPGRSPWEGMSGAAVFSGGRLVGVVAEHHTFEGPGRLAASHVGRWAEVLEKGLEGAELDRLESLLGHRLRPADLPDVVEHSSPPRTAPDEGTPRPVRGVRTHAQELARGANKKKYLTEDRLPFVHPQQGRHPADPDNLWARLTAPSPGPARGVILIGPAGAGKTRTCFEVAALADRADGWRVLHIAADARVTAADLVAAVSMPPRQNVLLVFDYLDTYAELNLTHLVDELEERESPGTRVACIASVRPGRRSIVERQDRRRLFEWQDMCQDDDYERAVTDRILTSVAPSAVAEFGQVAVAALCGGRRPAVALMRAQAIESGARDGATLRELSTVGSDDLSFWARQRTDEDFPGSPGTGGPGGRVDPAQPRTALLAAAVAAVACAQDRAAVQKAVRYFLDHHEGPKPATGAEGVIGGLVRLGWLLSSDGELDVVHDTVADEFLHKACFPDGPWFQGDTARELFSAALVSTRTLRLAAGHVRRWAADLGAEAQTDVRLVCEDWLDSHALTLGERLSGPAERETGGTALLTLLAGAPWQSGAMAAWDRLVEPWLRTAGQESPPLVRNLFANAVRNTSDAVPERLAAAALDWLRHHRDQAEARGVVEALARATGLPDEQRAAAVHEAVEWLAIHGVGPRNRPVFVALLDRDDLTADVMERVLDLGLTGIRRYLPVAATVHLLRTVLYRTDLTRDRLDRAVRLGHLWLTSHKGKPEASFVLRPLLTRPETDAPWHAGTIGHALAWLKVQDTSREASFVVGHVLAHPHLAAGDVERAVGHAARWLVAQGTSADASFVLRPLLSRDDPERIWTAEATAAAVMWLEHHTTREDAAYVLRSLLDHPALPPALTAPVAERALAWLAAHHRAARSVLPGLLALPGPHGPDACAAALGWLEVHHATLEACYVLDPVLDHPALDGQRAEDAIGYALAWLAGHGTSDAASFVFRRLLARDDLADDVTAAAVGSALTWLEPRHTDAEARFVLGAVLRHPEPGQHPGQEGHPGQERAITFALAWLRAHGTADHAGYVLRRLLGHPDGHPAAQDTDPDPDPEWADEAVRHAFRWLEIHHVGRQAGLVVWPLLGQPGLDPQQRCRAAELALQRLVDHPSELGSQRVRQLCRLGEVPPELGARIADQALALMGSRRGVRELLPPVLRRRDIHPDQVARLADRALEHLADSPTRGKWGQPLRVLLSRADLDAERKERAAERALEWLRANPVTTFSGLILEQLLKNGHLDAAGGDVVSMALGWLDVHATHTFAGNFLAELLSRPDLTPGQYDDCAAYALRWLGTAERTDSRVPPLMEALLHRPDRTDGS
ncbi:MULTISPECIES: trypsin-like peptidase domain-containing protein [Streptomyces]|nr:MULTISPECIES: trypsin-like peptidase domain-containing protein [Streptomyces]